MTDKELIKKFKTLKEIKPNKEWALMNKASILGQEKRVEIFPFFKPVYAGLFCLLLLAGLFEFSQDSLPGEYLYSLKRIMEKGESVLLPEGEKAQLNLELVNRRLEELNKIVQDNEMKKLAPALKEYQISVSKATKDLAKMMTTTSDPMILKQIVEQTQTIEQNKEKLTKIHGIVGLEDADKPNLIKMTVEWLIKDLDKSSLVEEKQAILEEAKICFENEDYSGALEKILEMNDK